MAIDPQARALLDAAEQSGRPLYETMTPPAARRQYADVAAQVGGAPPQMHTVENIEAPGPFGPIPLRVYIPRDPAGRALPLLIYFHGGGWVIGDLDSHDIPCRRLAQGADCIVVSVDYRMAPEFPFPQPVEDCWAATQWIAANAASLGGQPNNIAVGGDSAGGNLATVMCLKARDAGGPALVFQLLVYPATELTRSFPSHEELAEGYRLTRPMIDWFMDNYFSGDIKDRAHPDASPLFADDLSNLPPALIVSAGFDPLKDECKAYAEKLEAAGTRCRHDHYPGMIHGFINMTGFLDKGVECLDACGAALKQAFAAK